MSGISRQIGALEDRIRELEAELAAEAEARREAETYAHRLADELEHHATAAKSMSEGLTDPRTIHRNMLTGTIAKPSVESIIHVYGREALIAALCAPDPASRTEI